MSPTIPASSGRVLIVDDQENWRETLSELLRADGQDETVVFRHKLHQHAADLVLNVLWLVAGETIRAAARKCRFCDYRFDTAAG